MKKKLTLKGNILRYNIGSQLNYYDEIRKLIEQMINTCNLKITRLLNKPFAQEYFAMDDSIASQARILLNKLSDDFVSLFKSKARQMADKMVNGQVKLSDSAVKSSLKKMSEEFTLKGNIVSVELEEVIKSSVTENVSLINSIPEQYFTQITGEVMRGITSGKGASDISKSLMKYEGVTKRRAKEIAADQVRKVYTSVNIEKLKSIDAEEFIWVHSGGGQEPRESHLKMDGKKFSLNYSELIEQQKAMGVKDKDLGFPGYPVNCRCTMQAVL